MSSKINLITRLQHWMDSVPGQTFLNYAYSWGASIVILGALFKLTHLPGGNLMLFAGMGTEVFVFFLSAFDRPFDKTEIGKELPHDYQTDEEIAATLAAQEKGYAPETEERETPDAIPSTAQAVVFTAPSGVSAPAYVAPAPQTAAPQPQAAPTETAQPAAPAAQGSLEIPRDADAEQLAAIIRAANDELLHRAQAVLSPEMETATKTYIEKLQTLTDTFQKVDEQSARLTRDSEEMENLNRTLTGINKVYELHLKSISLQVGTIDDINNQTHKLAEQIQRLNSVYARMIDALTVNMVNQSAAAPREQSES
ncbi:type IX secretion system motor protein PorL/GldL [Alloprevotella tannerae]